MRVRVPIESIQYLLDVFIEGGYAEEEDTDHLDAIHEWLEHEHFKARETFQKRVRDVNPDYNTAPYRAVLRVMPGTEEVARPSTIVPVDVILDWDSEPRPWNLSTEHAFPTDYPEPEEEPESRAAYRIEDHG